MTAMGVESDGLLVAENGAGENIALQELSGGSGVIDAPVEDLGEDTERDEETAEDESSILRGEEVGVSLQKQGITEGKTPKEQPIEPTIPHLFLTEERMPRKGTF